MTTTQIVTAITIHLLIPIIGLLFFSRLIKRMSKENIPKASIFELFIIFATYGGLLLVILTSLFWQWSGMASLGMFYLILVAPIVMGVIAYRNYKKRKTASFYSIAYKAGITYYIITPLSFLILFLILR